MDIVKDIAAIIGCILAAFNLVAICTKQGRALIRNWFSRNTKDLQEENRQQSEEIQKISALVEDFSNRFDKFEERFGAIEENARQQCRNTIKNIYYRYQKDRKIPLYERKTADKTYDIYHNQLHGNSYAKLLYEEICKWEIDKITYKDLTEEGEE